MTKAIAIWFNNISSFSNISNIIQMFFPIVNKKCELIIKNRQRILGGGTRNSCTGAQNLPQKSLKICCNLLLTPQNYDKIERPWINPLQRVLRFDTSLLHFTFALRRTQHQFCTSLLHFGAIVVPQSACLRHSFARACTKAAKTCLKASKRRLYSKRAKNLQICIDTPARVW